MYLPRFRRINEVLKEIKEYDPNTALNWRIIKSLIKSGKLSMLKLGPAWLINADELYSLFTNKEEK